MIEGDAVRVTDEAMLQRIADASASKYEGWHFEVRDGAFLVEGGGVALVFEVAPVTVFGFGKGDHSARPAGASERRPAWSAYAGSPMPLRLWPDTSQQNAFEWHDRVPGPLERTPCVALRLRRAWRKH